MNEKGSILGMRLIKIIRPILRHGSVIFETFQCGLVPKRSKNIYIIPQINTFRQLNTNVHKNNASRYHNKSLILARILT